MAKKSSTWICSKCGCENSLFYYSCTECGNVEIHNPISDETDNSNNKKSEVTNNNSVTKTKKGRVW